MGLIPGKFSIESLWLPHAAHLSLPNWVLKSPYNPLQVALKVQPGSEEHWGQQ